ncbi:hypothetical protein JG688_00014864 [Phytophthora aleatoria]|uniref:Uncharacterized protein n=1 Tax=Phytophthora aleatoria TaxID=2496075 RepID=A0A8J5IF96_9STRA|nr:hypothetical protein JG688_00014864 [Phytophthora aleatoria]
MSDSEEHGYEYDSDDQFGSEERGSAADEEDDEAAQQRHAAREAPIALENTFYEAEDFLQRGDFVQGAGEGKIYLDIHEFDQLQKLLTQPYEYFQTPDSVQHPSKATALLDGYALEIQAPTAAELCVTTKTSAKMRVIYPKTLDLDAAVADP